jgi:hypothetical protein
MKLLEKSRDDRFANAHEAIEALAACRASLASPPPAKPQVPAPPLAPPGPVPTPAPAAAVPVAPAAAVPVGPAPMPNAMQASTRADLPAASFANHPTNAGPQPWASDSLPTQASSAASGVRETTPKWQIWAAGAGAVMLLLMTIGAWQAIATSDDEAEDAPASADDTPAAAAPPKVPLRDDFNCSDGRCTCAAGVSCELDCKQADCVLGCTKTRSCTLACGDDCRASCVDVPESCSIRLGPGGEASCAGSPTCEVSCEGACEVACPDGGCEVRCLAAAGASARSCGETRVCGGSCP